MHNRAVNFLILRSTGVDIEITPMEIAQTDRSYENCNIEVHGERCVLEKFGAV